LDAQEIIYQACGAVKNLHTQRVVMEQLDIFIAKVLSAPSPDELALLNVIALMRETLDLMRSYHDAKCFTKRANLVDYGCNCHASAIACTYIDIEQMLTPSLEN